MRLLLIIISWCCCVTMGHARYQALWVDAFNPGIYTPEETRRLIELARQNGINALFVQVSKTADAFYQSNFVPPARQLQPGYDALADLLRQAHDTADGKPRIEIHAWVICYRVATASDAGPGYLLKKNPGWQMTGFNGEQRFDDHYFTDPGVPAVQEFYARLVREIAQKYPVDGIHLDRIRYPADVAGYNPISLKRFHQQYRRNARPEPDDPQWNEFRRRQITSLVERIRYELHQVRPAARLSASVAAFEAFNGRFEDTVIYQKYLQDWPTWSRQGLLDLVCPMIYKREHVPEQQRDFRAWLAFAANHGSQAQVIAGLGAFLNQLANTQRQILMVGQQQSLDGFCLYSYANLSDRPDDSAEKNLRSLRQTPGWAADLALTPPPTLKQGMIAGRAQSGRQGVDGAPVELSLGEQTRKTITDGNGYYVFYGLAPGDYQVKLQGSSSPSNVKLRAGNLAKANFWLK